MAKRKAAVNDIIYELDNDDSEISDDEVTQPKIQCLEENNSPATTQSDSNTQSSCLEVIDIDSSTEKVKDSDSLDIVNNGGKYLDEFIIVDEVSETSSPKPEDRFRKLNSDTIFNEDIVIDSPASNIDLGVVGCENRTPLVTVRFRDSKLAMNYKKKIKAFLLSLIKLHDNDVEVDDDTDLELDVWPEEVEGEVEVKVDKASENLFFIDTDPSIDMHGEIPRYSQNLSMLSNISEKEPSPPPMFRKGPICFNCEGSHALRDCKLPRNNVKINERRKAIQKLGRYHVEDEQKYGHLVGGRISGELRHALGLKRHELPLHIYRMRQMGYPPGWLEEARISHSGITLFDSSGQATLDPEDEEGEVYEPGSKDKFDIKKILDFPGFNVPASSRYKEEAHKLGLPPMSEQDSKMAMLQVLAPNAMKAYKRKKLTFFPSAPDSGPVAGPAEMDIDSGDEVAEFPSQPPLPDDAPPPPPPPPATPPLPTELPPETPPKPHSMKNSSPIEKLKEMESKTESDDDIEVVEVIRVGDIPVPVADLITIDVEGETSDPVIELLSPSLDDLEKRKKLLLDALETDVTILDVELNDSDVIAVDNKSEDDTPIEENAIVVETEEDSIKDIKAVENDTNTNTVQDSDQNTSKDSYKNKVEDIDRNTDGDSAKKSDNMDIDLNTVSDSDKNPDKDSDKTTDSDKNTVTQSDKNTDADKTTDTDKNTVKDSDKTTDTDKNTVKDSDRNTDSSDSEAKTKSGRVRSTHYGTPVLNIASPFEKLPSDDKFAKDICDVINFENLPNSTGKYKQISTLLKKVKSEVDRIQES